MACVNPDGTLTASARALLQLTAAAALTPEEISRQLGEPLYKVRSSLREMVASGLLQEQEGRYSVTGLGREG